MAAYTSMTLSVISHFSQGSWQAAINHRFKNLRKTKKTLGTKGTPTQQTTSEQSAAAPPAVKKHKAADVPQLPEGETRETCEEHRSNLAKEMSKKTNRNMLLIKNLMEITYPYRRQNLLENPIRVDDILQEYPALQLVSEVCNTVWHNVYPGVLLH